MVSLSVVVAFDLTTFECELEISEVKMLQYDRKLQSSWRICKCWWVLDCVLRLPVNMLVFYHFIFMFFLKTLWNGWCLEIFSLAFARCSSPINKKCLMYFCACDLPIGCFYPFEGKVIDFPKSSRSLLPSSCKVFVSIFCSDLQIGLISFLHAFSKNSHLFTSFNSSVVLWEIQKEQKFPKHKTFDISSHFLISI